MCSYDAQMRETDLEALELFRTTALPVLEESRGFIRSSDGRPEAGSALAADDELWPHHPLSQVAWYALISASDHLDLIAKVVEMAEERTFVTASFSLARGALVAASQALWLVADEDASTRQQRGLSVAIEAQAQRLGWQREQLKVCTAEQQELSKKQIVELLEPELAEAQSRAKKGFRFTDTQVIERAARYRYASEVNVDAAVVTAGLLWRRLGGDAHALGWQLMLSEPEWEPGHEPEELAPAVVTADIESFVQAAMWSSSFFRVAVDRFRELSSAPSS